MSQQPPLARYSFVPWLRQGLASSITQADTLGTTPSGLQERVSIQVTLNINDTDSVNREVKIIGPGDIIGIEERAVVRTEPKPKTVSFEPNFLAAVEFYDEDFLWRYTPAAATPQERLRPWLCLVVVTKDDDEFERFSAPGMPLPGLRLKVGDVTDVFPRPDQVWAWAHVHVNRDIKARDNSPEQAVANLAGILATNTDLAISRLVSPRRLKPNRGYDAFVIPAFEAGRLVGLGQPVPPTIDPLQSAWGAGQKEFPIYYQWSFRTGDRGDFEFLVRLLKPRVLDPRVGIRPMDVQRPEYGLPAITNPPALGLEGALKTPDTRSTAWPGKEPFQTELTNLVNQSDVSLEPGATSDPVVTPPLYGRWHAAVRRLRDPNNPPWIDTLNLDPRHRVAAGFGTLIIQEHQEEYMNAAWQQVGAIEEANRLLRLARFARMASLRQYGKHLESAAPAQLLSLTAQVHRRTVDAPSGSEGRTLTVRQHIAESTLPLAAVRPSFRRMARPRGPVARRVGDLRASRPGTIAERLNRGEITAAPPKAVPGPIVTMDRVADKLKPPEMRGCLALAWPVLRPIFPIVIAVLAFVSRFVAALRPTVDNLRRLFEQQNAAETMRGGSLTPAAARRAPARPAFQLTRPGDSVPAVGAGGRDSAQAANFRAALVDLTESLTLELPPVPEPRPLNLQAVQQTLLQELHPGLTIATRFNAHVFLPGDLRIDPDDLIAPIMAAPDLPWPMYAPLRDKSAEYLCPNLNLIPPNTISLLITNEPFIEAYMAGLNHEVSRELLWREFPTDQRGSYFRQFWDVSDVPDPAPNLTPAQRAERLKDIKPIHRWLRPANLGDNNNRPLPGNAERLVLVVRGDLLRRYPTAVIFAVKARWLDHPDGEGRTRLPHEDEYSTDPARVKQVVMLHSFKAKVEPDLRFIGFDLTVDEARGAKTKEEGDAGWFFVIQERPGEPRFGFDEPDGGFDSVQTIHHWNDLTWGHLASTQAEFDRYSVIDLAKPLHRVGAIQAQPGTDPSDTVTRDNEVGWASNAADMAYILLQIPVKIYVHASEMLSEKRPS